MPDPSKVLDGVLGPWSTVFCAVLVVALVWLLCRDLKFDPTSYFKSNPAGFTAFSRWSNAQLRNPYSHFDM